MPTPETQAEVDKAGRHFDALSREWDDADSVFQFEWRAAGGQYKDMDPEILRRRFKIGLARRDAAYRLKVAEYTNGDRSVQPVRPNDPECTDSPYYNG
jgi:hypothetical protein